ncbi:hypothetical protein ACWCYY_32855, partial [Kitasatospora sp. NPDC001664]
MAGALAPAALAAPKPSAKPTAKPAEQPSASVNEAPDEASALLAARLNKRRIEVTGARTANTTLWANPEGTLTQDIASGPVRMKSGGAWVPVDTTLVERPDGKVAPKAHPESLEFAGGDAAVKSGDALPGAAAAAPSESAQAAGAPADGRGKGEQPAERGLVKVGNGARQVELGWLGKLPKPKLSGSKATYVNARPGVDLVLEATRTGFE